MVILSQREFRKFEETATILLLLLAHLAAMDYFPKRWKKFMFEELERVHIL